MSNAQTIRIKLILSQDEYAALLAVCERTLRTPDAEVHYIVRQELWRLGVLGDEVNDDPRQ